MALEIGVVGAGIAGLAAAAALARTGHSVDVYERSEFANEIGAAVNVGPNAAPVMRMLGFDYEGARLLAAEEGVQLDGVTMQEKYRGQYDDFEQRFGAPWYFSHRVDLHSELRRLAEVAGARLHLASKVTDVSVEDSLIHFANGSSVRKDVIIGADGVHSIVARRVLGGDQPAAAVGECAFRFLIPTQKLLENEVTRPLFQETKTTFHIAAVPDRRLVWYPCRGGEVQNFVALHPAKQDREEEEDWQASGSLADLLQTYEGFHPALLEICRSAEDLKLWKLLYRPPIQRWTSGNVIIIGDAAHPMLPHQGQGANQAIEDAGALSVFLSGVKDKSEVAHRLQMIQDVRKNRAAAIQIFSNAGQDQAARIAEEARPFVQGPIPSNQAEFHEWNFNYNVLEHSRAALQASKA